MLAPIPKSALGQQISVGGITYTNVLIEARSTVVSAIYGMQQQSNYLLMIDKVNTPKYEELKGLLIEQAIVEFGGRVHTVTEVETLIDRKFNVEHHYEVRLT